MGPLGILLLTPKGGKILVKHYHPQKKIDQCVSATGAGDTFVGVLISQIANQGNGMNWDVIIPYAMQCSELTLMSNRAVSEHIKPRKNSNIKMTFSISNSILSRVPVFKLNSLNLIRIESSFLAFHHHISQQDWKLYLKC